MHAKEKQEVTQPLTVDLTPFKHGMELSPWERVQVSRRNDRPVGEDYIQTIFPDFIEFHGDRYYKDDASIIGGIATLGGMPVTVIAQTKGHDTKENLKRNFGMPSPGLEYFALATPSISVSAPSSVVAVMPLRLIALFCFPLISW